MGLQVVTWLQREYVKYFMAQPKGFVMKIKEEKECCLKKSFTNDNIQR
jgi:hypothetical protein